MAPWRGQSKGQCRQCSWPAEVTQPQQQDVPEADPAQGSRATAPNINLPTTPIHQGGPFHVPQYNPPPLAPQPASPSGEDFDFTEADTIPLSVPPAAGNLSSPVKRARAVGGNQINLPTKKWSRSLGGKWWGYYWYVAVILKFLHNNISITEAAWKAWRSNIYAFGNVPRPWKHCPISSSTMILPLFTNYQCRPSSMFSSDIP